MKKAKEEARVRGLIDAGEMARAWAWASKVLESTLQTLNEEESGETRIQYVKALVIPHLERQERKAKMFPRRPL
jgi:hypothetical protein